MKWRGDRESGNVDDQRGSGFPGGGRGLAIGGAGLGTVILAVVIALLGGDPRALFQGGGPAGPAGAPQNQQAEDDLKHFVGVVLADTEDVWNDQFQKMHKTYREPKLVLYRDQVDTGCGQGSAAIGPFYCPADEKVYLDLGFFDELKSDLNAPGEFAEAYVIAHEVGHHVQKLLGTSDKVDALRQRADEKEANQLSVRLELQADFYAGVWANHAEKMKHILEPGDIESALNAAHQIGDDYLEKRAQGRVVPDSFTHGTSEQRMKWFKKGFDTGDMSVGDQLFTLNYKDL